MKRKHFLQTTTAFRKPVKEIRLMRSGTAADFRQNGDGWIELTVPKVEDFEMTLCLY